MPDEIRRLSEKFLKNPVEIQVARQNSTAETITQSLVKTGSKPIEKRATLRAQIENAVDIKNAIIFCNRKRDIAVLDKSLRKHGYNAGALHGDMDQKSRMDTLASFKEGKLKFLIASDVAARGLDIPDVSHVYNFDIPTQAEDYVHRIGRTGRAGRSGTAITLVTPAETKYYKAIEKLIGKEIPWGDTASTPQAEHKKPETAKKPSPKLSPKPEAKSEAKSEAKPKSSEAKSSDKPKNHPKKTAGKPQENPSKQNQATPFGDESAVPAFLLQIMPH